MLHNMIKCLLIMAIASCVCAAQQIDVIASRSIDGIIVELDSVRIECDALQFDTTVTTLPVGLSSPTGVLDIEPIHPALYTADIYDLQGRVIVSGVQTPSLDGIQWLSSYGVVYVVHRDLRGFGMQPRRSSNGRPLGSITHRPFGSIADKPLLRVTAWRTGYEPVHAVVDVPESNTTIAVVLELKPWWHRVRTLELSASGPKALAWTRNASSRNGGTSEYAEKIGYLPLP